jgi:regulator of cell morphogenesis and NO signaling
MALIYATTRLSDVIMDSVEVVPVLNRFGITLGTGEATVGDAANAHNLDVGFLLAILNTFVNEEYFPEATLKAFCSDTVKYLTDAHRYYEEYHFPNIERHFALLMKASSNDTNLSLMLEFFHEFKRDLIARYHADMSTWIPVLVAAEQGENKACANAMSIDDSAAIDDRMNDLKLMYIKHLKGHTDTNLCYAVLTALSNLERDLRQNDRIRDRILIPLYSKIVSL